MKPITIEFKGKEQINIYYHIVIIGAGGTGGLVIQQLAQMFSMFGIWGKIVIAEPDLYEEKNLRNQLCLPKDINKNKADVLAQRYRAAYQMDIATYTSGYVEDVKTLEKLYETTYERCNGYNTKYVPVLISCVDNNYSRKVFHQYFEQADDLLYLDVGNETIDLPEDYQTRPKEQWSEEELDRYHNSGFTGQLVCGLKLGGQVITEPIASIFPDILEDNDEIAPPSKLSCQELAASLPQRLIVNRYSALSVITILNEIFETGSLSTHKVFYHAKKAFMKSEPIYG